MNKHYFARAISKVIFCTLVVSSMLLSGCKQTPAKPNSDDVLGTVEDYEVVDCLLPGQLRRLGSSSYMTPRRPARTTAPDCAIRGGEYVAYDRSNYKTALTVWMASAQQGDAEAQANVGEIFERGLGSEPNYEVAAYWYKQSAAQGNTRAQFNLATLYEQGLGVPQDKLQALNWYRKAWSLPEDSLVYQTAARREVNKLKIELEKKIEDKNARIASLEKQASDDGDILSSSGEKKNKEVDTRFLAMNALKRERDGVQNAYDILPRFRQPQSTASSEFVGASKADIIEVDDVNFGRYYALIVGVQNYQAISSLKTPYADAKRAQDILENQYGFNVKLLLDPDNATLMKAINDLNDVVTDKDNLLIFYAGHGSRIQTGQLETGYWLPSNASLPPDDTYWVSNEFVSRHLSRLPAKRIMVIADSCYAGLLSTSPGYLLLGKQEDTSEQYIRYKLPQKSRLLLSSGGDRPVLDSGGGGHSVFARAFLDTLEESRSVMSGPELFLKIRNKMIRSTHASGFEQEPEFKAIKGAGHEAGDFFFVKRA